ncbi:MAG: antibiotic biosynthesis monooxygenase [Tannerella sp.]|jgi:quinol monooxygenase YgiN|nr:antibiotic biosynthesis monooxygenase [Tannerella sp.]
MKKVVKNLLWSVALCPAFLLFSCKQAPQQAAAPTVVHDTVRVVEQKAPAGDILVIVAHVTVKKAEQAAVEKAFQDVVAATHKDAGNIDYNLYQDVKDPLKYTFIEYWKSQSAINAHNASPAFQAFTKAIKGKATLEAYTLKHKF